MLGLAAFLVFSGDDTYAAGDDPFVGKAGPAFHVEDWISQVPDREGKYLLVDFWATWCGPCIRAIPHMNELHSEFKDELTVVGISNESRAKVESMKGPKMDYYSAIDTSGAMAGFFQIRSIPHVVLMDPEGTVLYKGHPAYLSAEKVSELIARN